MMQLYSVTSKRRGGARPTHSQGRRGGRVNLLLVDVSRHDQMPDAIG